MPSKIQWTEETWNPITGCSHVSPGCEHCYAETLSLRFGHSKHPWGAQWAKDNVVLYPERLEIPLHWRKPKMVFTCSMADLFHEEVPFSFIKQVWEVMQDAHQKYGHIFQVLTKRPARMREALGPRGFGWYAVEAPVPHPEPGIWLGVSVEDQQRADERIPLLLQTPAAVRFVSAEPLLGDVTLNRYWLPCLPCVWGQSNATVLSGTHTCWEEPKQRLNWVIVGGESGAHARPMELAWARSIRDQCQAAGVPLFVKQFGSVWAKEEADAGAVHGEERRAWDPKGGNLEEWPEDLRVREWPQGGV